MNFTYYGLRFEFEFWPIIYSKYSHFCVLWFHHFQLHGQKCSFLPAISSQYYVRLTFYGSWNQGIEYMWLRVLASRSRCGWTLTKGLCPCSQLDDKRHLRIGSYSKVGYLHLFKRFTKMGSYKRKLWWQQNHSSMIPQRTICTSQQNIVSGVACQTSLTYWLVIGT